MQKSLRFPSCLLILIGFFLSSITHALTLEESGSGFCAYNGSIQGTYLGAANNQYVNLSNDAGKGITWAVQAAQAGNYSVQFRYASSGTQNATKAAIRVNGVVVSHGFPFPVTGDWSNWQLTSPFTVSLNAGNNTIRLETIVATEFANIDSIIVSGTNLAAGTCAGAGSPKSPNNGVISNPQSPVLAATPSASQDIDFTQSMPASFSVNSNGQAVYSIPVLIAPGSGGLKPEITLSYSSGSSNGIAGLGWELEAGGAISRCRQTKGVDGIAKPIAWTSEDRFCLNGQRLLVTSGAYGAPGSLYKTEIDSFARITAVGGSSGNPDYFKVEYKNGSIETYGNTSDSAYSKNKLSDSNSNSVLDWSLSKRQDSSGNIIIYGYVSDSDGQRIDTVSYAYGSTLSRGAYVQFNYESRNDPIAGFVAGFGTKIKKRLASIVSYNGSAEIRSYYLTYNQSSANTNNDKISRINNIRECVGAKCSSGIDFTWDIPGNYELGSETSFSFSGGVSTYAFGDINGDGLQDVAWFQEAYSDPGDAFFKSRKLNYALGKLNANGTFSFDIASFSNGSTDGPSFNGSSIKFVDVNGDGRMDAIVSQDQYGHDGAGYGYVNSVHEYVLMSLPQADGSWKLSSVAATWNSVGGASEMSLDANGDGLVDSLRWATPQLPWDTDILSSQTNETAATQSASVKVNERLTSFQSKPLRHILNNPNVLGDLNVNNMDYQGSADYSNDLGSAPIRYFTNMMGDFNGDGQMDLIAAAAYTYSGCAVQDDYERYCSNPQVGESLQIYSLNEVSGGSFELRHQLDLNKNISLLNTLTEDLNGDGLTDLVKTSNIDGAWKLSFSDGLKMTSDIAIGVTTYSRWLDHQNLMDRDGSLADVNGDGYQDFIWRTPNSPLATSGIASINYKLWDPQVGQFESGTHQLMNYSYAFIANYFDVRTDKRYSYFRTESVNFMDLNGDSVPDLVISPSTQSGALKVRLGSNQADSANKITSIINEFGKEIRVEYSRINATDHYDRIVGIKSGSLSQNKCINEGGLSNYCWSVQKFEADSSNFYKQFNQPWDYLTVDEQTLSPTSPVIESFGPMLVVTSVESTAPAANDASPLQIDTAATTGTSYFYGQAKMQAGGRGFLGFKYFTAVDWETGIRNETEYRQDWPFIGVERKNVKYTKSGFKLSESSNIFGIVDCYDSSGNSIASCSSTKSTALEAGGSKSLGPIQTFIHSSETKVYALKSNGSVQGDLISTTEEVNTQDSFGNILSNSVHSTSDLDVTPVNRTTVSTYIYPSASWSTSLGRIQRMSVTSENSKYGTTNRTSAFDYYLSGSDIGLLKTETIEPESPDYVITTTHTYSMGNRVASITAAEGQTRQTEVEYDDRGRYIDNTYDFFTDGVNVSAPIRRLVGEVTSRDAYGAPTMLHSYFSPSAYTTTKLATSSFGVPYFSAKSTGEYIETQMGLGVDSGGICPVDTKVWSLVKMAGGSQAIKCLDLLGRVRREGTLSFDGSGWNLVDTEYNRQGFVLRVSAPYVSNSASHYWTTYTYDVLGRITSTQSPYKNTTVETTNSYNNLDVTITNPKGQVRVEKRDLEGHVIEVVDPNNGVTKFAYDSRGNMREMKDPAQNTTVIGYDLRDRKVSMSDPDKGSWVYTYNRFNELTCQKDGKGQVLTMDYDIRGRMVNRIERPTCTSSALYFGTYWVYDKASNGMGQLESVYTTPVNTPEFRQRLKYDSRGRLSTKETSFFGHLDAPTTHNEKIVYDQYNRVYQQFDAAREVSSFESNGLQNAYNVQGYLFKVMDAVSYAGVQQAYYTITGQDARGHVTQALYGNGVTQVADFEPETGLASNIQAFRALPLSAIQDMHLEWDEVGNLSSRSEKGTAGESSQRNINESFGYDSLNRLNSWTTSGDISASDSVQFDAVDNIRLKNGMSYSYGSECGSGTNAGPHAVCRVGGVNYYYDKNGNQTSDGSGRVIQYTRDDLPSQITFGGHKTQFAYDPMRARYKRVDTASGNQVTTTLYIGSVEKVFYPDGTVEWKRGIAGVGQITQTLNAQGVIAGEAQRYFIKDHLGSLGLITDEIGAVEQANYFDPWGAERKVVSSGSIKQWLMDNNSYRVANKPITTRGFTGHEHLAEVGLIHMNGRIYDAKLARFVQADPIIQDPLKVQSLNRYSYVWNNPLNATDPSGFTKCDGNACTDDKGGHEVANGANNCSSGKCQNYVHTDKNGNKTTVSVNKSDQKAFEKELKPMMKSGYAMPGVSQNSFSGSSAHISGGKGGGSSTSTSTANSQKSASATETTQGANKAEKREELSRDGKIRFVDKPYDTPDEATLAAYREYEEDYFNLRNDQELLGVIFKYRDDFYYTTPAVVPADTNSEPTPLTVSEVPDGASQYRNYHTHPEGNLNFSGADLRGVNETGIPIYLRNMDGDVKLLEGIPLTGKSICDRCLSPLPQKL